MRFAATAVGVQTGLVLYVLLREDLPRWTRGRAIWRGGAALHAVSTREIIVLVLIVALDAALLCSCLPSVSLLLLPLCS